MEQSQRLASRSPTLRASYRSLTQPTPQTPAPPQEPDAQLRASQSKRRGEASRTLGLNRQRNPNHLFPRLVLGGATYHGYKL